MEGGGEDLQRHAFSESCVRDQRQIVPLLTPDHRLCDTSHAAHLLDRDVVRACCKVCCLPSSWVFSPVPTAARLGITDDPISSFNRLSVTTTIQR